MKLANFVAAALLTFIPVVFNIFLAVGMGNSVSSIKRFISYDLKGFLSSNFIIALRDVSRATNEMHYIQKLRRLILLNQLGMMLRSHEKIKFSMKFELIADVLLNLI
jgi:hypothetical protein